MRGIISVLMIVFLTAAVSTPAFAAPRGKNEMESTGPRRHLGTIVFAGIAGAILGLSTLSFYGRPQDRLSNIAVGAAIGIIGGAMYTTYKAASEPKDFYGWQEAEAESWKLSEFSRFDLEAQSVPSAVYSFEF
jgi:hypothetical protein